MDSTIRVHTSQLSRSQNGGRGKQENNGSDAFMRLSDREIAGCISDIGLHFSPEDLLKPNPLQIQKVFEWFAELLMNATRETIEPAIRAAAKDVCGDYAEIVPADTRNLMGFYVSLRKLLAECGINDFSFSDLLRPTHDRLVKIFSYIINFVRFRESQTAVIDEHFNKAERTRARIETLNHENQNMRVRLDEMKRERTSMDVLVKAKTERNDELKTRLLELKKAQERIAEHLEKSRVEKGRLTGILEERTGRCVGVRHESEKLRPYVVQSPAALEGNLKALSENIARDKFQIEGQEKRARALQTSTETFKILVNDVTSCIKVLEEISNELHKEEEENLRSTKRRDDLSERGDDAREMERTEVMLQRQLKWWQERIEALRKGSWEKAQGAKEKMDELRREHRDIAEERLYRGTDIERKKMRIEQTEKRMADLKETIENETRSAEEAYLKMNAHISLYMTEMEKLIM